MSTPQRDSGFTLVELMMYMIVFAIMMFLAGSIFIQIINHQGYVRDTAAASSSAQLAFKALESDVRSGSWGVVAQAGDLLVLQSRIVATSGVDYEACVGYYYDAGASQLRRWISTSGAETSAALAAPDDASLSAVADNWPVVTDEVSDIGGVAIFGPTDSAYTRGESIQMSLRAATSDDWPSVEFRKSVTLRPQSSEILDCY